MYIQYLLSFWSGLIHRHLNQKEKYIHSSHARPKTKTSDQLVGIADYMGAGLEVNGNHKMHMYIKCIYNRCTCDMTN